MGRVARGQIAPGPDRPLPADALAPQPGQQWAFHASPAEIVIYGGAAFGGKSWSLVFEAARNISVPGYGAIIFRRTSPEITGAGSIWEEAQGMYPQHGGRSRENVMDWRFPSGATIEFSHLQHEKSKFEHKSKQYAFVGFDELTSFTEGQFWYLYFRLRSMTKVRPYLRAATNPEPDSWVRRLIDWWIGNDGYPIRSRSGKIRWCIRDGDDIVWDKRKNLRSRFPKSKPISFTFIPANMQDNPIGMTGDPDYESKVDMLPMVEREQLKLGNWDIRPAAGLYFQRSYFETIGPDDMPAKMLSQCRGWDKAATKPTPKNPDPDWTAGAKWSRDANGVFYIQHVERFRDGPGGVERRIQNIATSDGRACPVFLWQDPGQAGKTDVDHYKRNVLQGFTTRSEVARENKITYAGPWSSQAEAGNVKLVRGGWNEAFLAEAEPFPEGRHDDQIDGCSGAYGQVKDSGLAALQDMTRW